MRLHYTIAAIVILPSAAIAQVSVSLEGSAAWQARNDVQIPGDAGTRFELDEVAGAGPIGTGRVTLDWDFAGRHGVRLVYAPLRVEKSGTLAQPVSFAGSEFTPGEVEATYQFNSPRVTYRYRVVDSERWQLRLGFTALVRDAEVGLRQGGVRARDTNVGFVPLLHVSGERSLSERVSLAFEVDGLAAPQGRAVDLGLHVQYALTDVWSLYAGYRTLEGGADNDTVFNFAWFNSAVGGVTVSFQD